MLFTSIPIKLYVLLEVPLYSSTFSKMLFIRGELNPGILLIISSREEGKKKHREHEFGYWRGNEMIQVWKVGRKGCWVEHLGVRE